MSRVRLDARNPRDGFTFGEAVVVLAIVVVCALFVMMALPRTRESARLASCQRNLSQIGMALLQYDRIQGRFPLVERYAPLAPGADASHPDSPLRTMLATLQLPDFTELTAVDKVLDRQPKSVPGPVPVRGFVCGSDPRAASGAFPAPISYRGSTGGDPIKPDGLFAAGRALTQADVDAGDGAGFTAAFAERLAGTGVDGQRTRENYQVATSPVPPRGCPPATGGVGYRGDAGSSWVHADYRTTLYNHSIPPNAPASCIAEDGRSAFMGASSGHVAGVNLLLLDGSLRTIRPTVDLKIWRDFGTIGSSSPSP
jgi:hypothetical protein